MSAVVEFISDTVEDVIDFVGDAIGDVVDFVSENPLILAAAVPMLPGVGLAAGAAGTTAAEMLAAEAAKDLAMGFTAADVALGLEGIGGLSGIGMTTAADMLAAEAAKDLAMGFSMEDIAMGLEGIGGLSGLGAAWEPTMAGLSIADGMQTLTPSWMQGIDDLGQLGYAVHTDTLSGIPGASTFDLATRSGNPLQRVGYMSFDPTLGMQYDIASAFKTYDASSPWMSQAPVPVSEVTPVMIPSAAQNVTLPEAIGDYLGAALENPKKAISDAIDFLSEARNTPVAKGINTLGGVVNTIGGLQRIAAQQDLLEKQKQMLDAQLAAYRTTGMQTGIARPQAQALPTTEMGILNYAGRYGIRI